LSRLKIFVFEYITGAGLAGAPLPKARAREQDERRIDLKQRWEAPWSIIISVVSYLELTHADWQAHASLRQRLEDSAIDVLELSDRCRKFSLRRGHVETR
jgi:hypothetical protein